MVGANLSKMDGDWDEAAMAFNQEEVLVFFCITCSSPRNVQIQLIFWFTTFINSYLFQYFIVFSRFYLAFVIVYPKLWNNYVTNQYPFLVRTSRIFYCVYFSVDRSGTMVPKIDNHFVCDAFGLYVFRHLQYPYPSESSLRFEWTQGVDLSFWYLIGRVDLFCVWGALTHTIFQTYSKPIIRIPATGVDLNIL